MMFDEKELRARQQFHELFATKYLYTGVKRNALSEDPWNAQILFDILTRVHPANPLVVSDIDTITQVAGMCDDKGMMYFHWCKDTPMVPEMLKAISPYITQKAYMALRPASVSNMVDSITTFLKLFCRPSGDARVETPKVYKLYQIWCVNNKQFLMGKHAFYAKLEECGYPRKKGYIKNVGAASFFEMRIIEQEVLQYVPDEESERTEETDEEAEGTFTQESLWDVPGGRAQVSADAESGVQETLYETTPGGTGVCIINGVNAELCTTSNTSDNVNDQITFDEIVQVPKQSVNTPTSGSKSEVDKIQSSEDEHLSPEAQIRRRVNKLDDNVRGFFKLMKITYKISPEHFTIDDFQEMYKNSGLLEMHKDAFDELYQLFLEYANTH